MVSLGNSSAMALPLKIPRLPARGARRVDIVAIARTAPAARRGGGGYRSTGRIIFRVIPAALLLLRCAQEATGSGSMALTGDDFGRDRALARRSCRSPRPRVPGGRGRRGRPEPVLTARGVLPPRAGASGGARLPRPAAVSPEPPPFGLGTPRGWRGCSRRSPRHPVERLAAGLVARPESGGEPFRHRQSSHWDATSWSAAAGRSATTGETTPPNRPLHVSPALRPDHEARAREGGYCQEGFRPPRAAASEPQWWRAWHRAHPEQWLCARWAED